MVPHSFPRSIRDLKSLPYWKANELKVFLLYTGVGALFTSLSMKYYQHFCLYVLIIRKLCDTDSPFNEQATESLLLFWHKELQNLYGEDEMIFTAYAHLHLPSQVARFGPLHKITGFIFEGMIKHIKKYISGPRFIGNQIANRLMCEKDVYQNVQTGFF